MQVEDADAGTVGILKVSCFIRAVWGWGCGADAELGGIVTGNICGLSKLLGLSSGTCFGKRRHGVLAGVYTGSCRSYGKDENDEKSIKDCVSQIEECHQLTSISRLSRLAIIEPHPPPSKPQGRSNLPPPDNG